jgi:hypothetical protein
MRIPMKVGTSCVPSKNIAFYHFHKKINQDEKVQFYT